MVNIKEWVKKTNKEMKEISDQKPCDRLDCIDVIAVCNTAVKASTIGWSEWLKTPGIMTKFSEEELNEIHEGFKKIAVIFLKMDVKWTKRISKILNLDQDKNVDELIDNYDKEVSKIPTEDCNNDTSYIS